jgi:hypothetical protein
MGRNGKVHFFERIEMHLAKVMRQRVVVEMIYLPIVPRRENHLTAPGAILRRNHDAARARARRK